MTELSPVLHVVPPQGLARLVLIVSLLSGGLPWEHVAADAKEPPLRSAPPGMPDPDAPPGETIPPPDPPQSKFQSKKSAVTPRRTGQQKRHSPTQTRPAAQLVESPSESLLSDEELAQRSAHIRSLNHVLYVNRQYESLLREATAKLAQGRPHESFHLLRQVLDASEDVFFWQPGLDAPQSALQAAWKIIARFTPEQLAAYQRYCEGTAQAELAKAAEKRSLPDYIALAARHAATKAGAQACSTAIISLFDQGRFEEVLALAEQFDALSDLETLSRPARERIAFAREQQATAGSTVFRITRRAASEAKGPPTRLAAAGMARAHWLSPHGTSPGIPGGVPFHRPLWKTSCVTEKVKTPKIQLASFTQSERFITAEAMPEEQRPLESEDTPVVMTSLPLLVGELVVSHRPGWVEARSLRTGHLLWQGSLTPWDNQALPEKQDSRNGTIDRIRSNARNGALLNCAVSDGQRLFVVDSIQGSPEQMLPEGAHPAGEKSLQGHSTLKPTNCLYAIELPARDDWKTNHAAHSVQHRLRILWRIGKDTATQNTTPLKQAYFLGPPVCADGLLYCLVEQQAEIHLIGIHSQSGHIEFQQGLAILDAPLDKMPSRARYAYMPAISGDMVICPTPAGAVIGWDRIHRTLRWVTAYADRSKAPHRQWTYGSRTTGPHSVVQPVVIGPHIALAPPDSASIHVLNTQTGQEQWRMARMNCHQVLPGPPNLLLCISKQEIECRQFEDGNVLWKQPLPSDCGRGAIVGEQLLLPTRSGRIVAIDYQSGRQESASRQLLSDVAHTPTGQPLLVAAQVRRAAPPKEQSQQMEYVPPGLATNGEWLITVQGNQLTAFYSVNRLCPLVEQERRRRRKERAFRHENSRALLPSSDPGSGSFLHSKLSAASDEELRLLHAELLILARRSEEAVALLAQSVSEAAPSQVEDSQGNSVQNETERLYRELLFLEIESLSEQSPEALRQLGPLIETSDDLARLAWLRARLASRTGNWPLFLDAAQMLLSSSKPGCLIPVDSSRTHFASAETLLRAESNRLWQHLSPQDRSSLQVRAKTEYERLAGAASSRDIQRFLHLFEGTPLADLARLRLAEQCKAEKQWHAAERLYVQLLDSSTRDVRLSSHLRLIRIWDQWDFHHEVNALLADSAARSLLFNSSNHLESSVSSQPVIETGRMSDTLPAGGTSYTATMTEWFRPEQEDVPIGIQSLCTVRRELTRPENASIRLLIMGEYSDQKSPRTSDSPPDDQVILRLLHRSSADVVGEMVIPSRVREGNLHFQQTSSSWLPLSGTELIGLSLLDQKVLWKLLPANPQLQGERIRLGPVRDGFCIVQTHDGLCRVDAATGNIQWQRRDLGPDAGLFASERFGLFGNDRHLIVFNKDLRHYKLLSMQTGHVLRAGCLEIPPVDAKRRRIVLGDRLLFLTTSASGSKICIWDPIQDRLIFEVDAYHRLCLDRIDHRYVACLDRSGTVHIVDARSGRSILKHHIQQEDLKQVSAINVFRDADSWYVNVVGPDAAPQHSFGKESIASDVRMQHVTLRGKLTCYPRDRSHAAGRTGKGWFKPAQLGGLASRDSLSFPKPRWCRSFEHRTCLLPEDPALPFLVTVSRVAHPSKPSQSSQLLIELIDRQNGNTVAIQGGFSTGQLVHMEHRAGTRQLLLHGPKRQIQIEYAAVPSQYVARQVPEESAIR